MHLIDLLRPDQPLRPAAIASIDALSQSQAAGRMGASRATRRPPRAP